MEKQTFILRKLVAYVESSLAPEYGAGIGGDFEAFCNDEDTRCKILEMHDGRDVVVVDVVQLIDTYLALRKKNGGPLFK